MGCERNDRRGPRGCGGGGGEAIAETAHDGSSYRLRLVAHDETAYDWFYNVVSNPTLWFLQHYLWDLAHSPNLDRGLHLAWEEGYVAVNANFADAVVAEREQPDAAVCFHDYHLYLAPRFVRARRPEAALSHFVHIPWPEPDYWRVLPASIRVALHDGCSPTTWSVSTPSAGVAAFSAPAATSSRRSATSSTRRRSTTAAGCSQRVTRSRSTRRSSTTSRRALRSSSSSASSKVVEQLVLRVDRTDPSKNVVRGFRAFERLLEDNPELHGRVGMLALLDPTRQDIPEYAEYLGAIRTARAVNDHFQTEGWTPIDLKIEDNFLQAVAAYKQYDVLLVNAIFDGLNLVAEGGARQRAERRARPFGERRRPRRAGGVGAHGQPVRHRGSGRGDPGRSRCPRTSGSSASWASASMFGSTTWPSGSRRSWPIWIACAPTRVPDLDGVLAPRRPGGVRMVDVGGSRSHGGARGRRAADDGAGDGFQVRELPKGDALAAAQLAGIMAAKRTSELIPLCHPLPLTSIDVHVAILENGADITSTVETTAQTGVEMEALVAASVAALTVYDMAKAVDDTMTLTEVRLLEKTKEPA